MDVVVLMVRLGSLTLSGNFAFFPRKRLSECECIVLHHSLYQTLLSFSPALLLTSQFPNLIQLCGVCGGSFRQQKLCWNCYMCQQHFVPSGYGKERLVLPRRKIFILLLSQRNWRVAAEQLETEKWAALQF